MRTVNIRGALGTQVISYAVALADGPVDHIFFNTGGDLAPHIKVNYLEAIVRDLPPVTTTKGFEKTRFDAPGVLQKAAKAAPTIPLARHIKKHGRTVLHIRVGDRESTTPESYLRAAVCIRDFVCLGNTMPLPPIDDWFYLLGAGEVYSSVSFFTISAAMVNPALKLHLLEPDGRNQIRPATMRELRKVVAEMDNIDWVIP